MSSASVRSAGVRSARYLPRGVDLEPPARRASILSGRPAGRSRRPRPTFSAAARPMPDGGAGDHDHASVDPILQRRRQDAAAHRDAAPEGLEGPDSFGGNLERVGRRHLHATVSPGQRLRFGQPLPHMRTYVPMPIVCVLLPRFQLTVAAGSRRELLQAPAALAPGRWQSQLVGEVSLAAEAFGVHPGLRVGEALARCPRLMLVPPDPGGVAEVWERVLARLESMGAGVRPERPGLACFDAHGLERMNGAWKVCSPLLGERSPRGRRDMESPLHALPPWRRPPGLACAGR